MAKSKPHPSQASLLVLLSAAGFVAAAAFIPALTDWFAWCSLDRILAFGGIHWAYLDRVPAWIRVLPAAVLWITALELLLAMRRAMFPPPEPSSEPEDYERRYRGIDSPTVDHLSAFLPRGPIRDRIREDLERHGIGRLAQPAERTEVPED